MKWDDAVLDILAGKVEYEADDGYAVEGAKEAHVVLSRHVSRALRGYKQRVKDAEPGGTHGVLPSVILRVNEAGQVVASDVN